MRTLAAILLLVGFALSGCFSGGGDDGPEPSASSSSTSVTTTRASSSTASTTTTTSAPPPSQNQPPTGSIAAAINGTSVNFTLSGSDADGDALGWTLDFGDGNATQGTALPATVLHNYTLAGNVTAVLAISDGEETASYNLTLALAPVPSLSQAYSGGFITSNPRCAPAPGVKYDAIPDSVGLSYDQLAVAPATQGRPFTVAFNILVPQGHLLFVDDAGAVLQEHSVGLPDETDLSGTATGIVPAGAALAVFYGCGTLVDVEVQVPPSVPPEEPEVLQGEFEYVAG